MKKRLYNILEASEDTGSLSWWVDAFLMTLILLNVVAVVVATVKPIHAAYSLFFYYFELFSVFVFSIEYVLRLWVANEDERFRRPVVGNLRYALTPMAVIDLLAVLPFYLPILGVDLRFARILRLFRLLRLFKIVRYIKALTLINKVLKEKREELSISILSTLFMLLITSSVMYYVEHSAQPEAFSSIPETMWWAIATLTTVGYGDVYPITGLGKLLGGVIAILGVGLFALPTGILASGFSEQLEKKTKSNVKSCCPHCGELLG